MANLSLSHRKVYGNGTEAVRDLDLVADTRLSIEQLRGARSGPGSSFPVGAGS